MYSCKKKEEDSFLFKESSVFHVGGSKEQLTLSPRSGTVLYPSYSTVFFNIGCAVCICDY